MVVGSTVGGNFEAAASSSVLVQWANSSVAFSLPADQEGPRGVGFGVCGVNSARGWKVAQ